MIILDESYINELRELAGEELDLIIALFLESLGPRIAELQASLHDSKAVAEAAHAIKGSAGNVGAVALARLAGEIESAAKNGNLLSVSQLVPGMDEICQSTLAAYAGLGIVGQGKLHQD